MTWLQTPEAESEFGKTMQTPIGAASPLWWAFAGVAGAGVAYWWMTRWAKPFNFEAEGVVPAPAPIAVAAAVEPIVEATEAVIETVEEVVEAAVEAIPAVDAFLAAPDAVTAAEIEAAPKPEPEPSPVASVPDDLTVLVGIGPKLAVALAERGVTQFSQIAAWGEAELSRFDAELSLKGRAVRDAWVAQAKRLSAEAVH
ncbi:hypothetical protein BH11PSE2_BH11PSE2_13260 [soil metagenome]